jgi:hypothetical protein
MYEENFVFFFISMEINYERRGTRDNVRTGLTACLFY